MNCRLPELTLDQLLADPLVRDVMTADHVDRKAVTFMLRSTARHFAADQNAGESSIIGRVIGPLMGLLAAYYGAALCGCMRPGSQFQICKAS